MTAGRGSIYCNFLYGRNVTRNGPSVSFLIWLLVTEVVSQKKGVTLGTEIYRFYVLESMEITFLLILSLVDR